MNIEKITPEALKKIITEEALKIMSAGDPLSVPMNKMAKVDNKEGSAYVAVNKDGSFEKKKAKNIESSEEATEVKMNANDKEGGSDAKVATAVSVKASSSTKSGDSVEGQHKADFESKESGPKVSASEPFIEKEGEVDMNEMDKVGEDGAKTYVQPGAEMHKTTSTGQHKGKFSEKAPGPETIERIAKGIQLPERFENKRALLDFINEEAKKVVRKGLLNEGASGDQQLDSDTLKQKAFSFANSAEMDKMAGDILNKMSPEQIDALKSSLNHINEGSLYESNFADFSGIVDSLQSTTNENNSKSNLQVMVGNILSRFGRLNAAMFGSLPIFVSGAMHSMGLTGETLGRFEGGAAMLASLIAGAILWKIGDKLRGKEGVI